MSNRGLTKQFLAILVATLAGIEAITAMAEDLGTLVAVKAMAAPVINGKVDDPVWQAAKALEVVVKRVLPPNEGVATKVTLRAAYTDAHIFIVAQWDDATQDVSHKSWMWNSDKKAYEEAKDREDMFAVAFEHSGKFTGNMLSGDEAVWDVWHWKAFRTNPQGYAMDKTHHYFPSEPQVKANKHRAQNGGDIWIARPEDQGDSVEKKQAAPAEYQSEQLAQYVPGSPSGSAADVKAKGGWTNGKWTLEFERKLDTGNPDDTVLRPDQSYKIAVAAFDRTGDMDKASPVIILKFGTP